VLRGRDDPRDRLWPGHDESLAIEHDIHACIGKHVRLAPTRPPETRHVPV
jgi:hypothetical protein